MSSSVKTPNVLNASVAEMMDFLGRRSNTTNTFGDHCWHIKYDGESFQVWGGGSTDEWEISFDESSVIVDEAAMARICFAVAIGAELSTIRECFEFNS